MEMFGKLKKETECLSYQNLQILSVVDNLFNLQEDVEALKKFFVSMELRKMITKAQNRIDDLSIEYNCVLTLEEDKEKAEKIYKKAILSAIENELNIYEKACKMYFRCEINREEFENDYKNEIKKISVNSYCKSMLNDKNRDFKSLNEIIKKWFDTGKKTKEYTIRDCVAKITITKK